ncbi:helix-turn-helix transcriptional regulator [Lachnospiraceae bacterium KK002]
MSQYQLISKYSFSAGQLFRLRKNENVSTRTLNTLCGISDCELRDIAIYKKNENE